jgi:hypothetical protein
MLVCWLSLVGLGAGGSVQANSERQSSPINAVLELFTSQGCSSCPEADALFESYAKRSDVLALSFSVDYWDYLGWKDTLAQPKFSKRQKHYSKARGDGQVYTPQMVVNGATHSVGSRKADIDKLVAETGAGSAKTWVPLTMKVASGQLQIETGKPADGMAKPARPDATLFLVMLSSKVDVLVKRGENSGKTLTYHNVVRDITPIGMWNGDAMTVRIDKETVNHPEAEACAVILQSGHTGPIMGAAYLPRC